MPEVKKASKGSPRGGVDGGVVWARTNSELEIDGPSSPSSSVGMLAATNTTTKAVGILGILGTRVMLFSDVVEERKEMGQRGEEGRVGGIGKEKREGSGKRDGRGF
ncbi:protein SAND [Pyrus ussuriensis x Pyrus communis]|uniref:Protein SAND n=1 Tax=Pyrus ussuriensis x Pyrus communis TaxID=2448454 RepID=A0A5N5FXK9_9ROSA|nr:protein SAND [Pyrus ussuriensis x Pyrus communis]